MKIFDNRPNWKLIILWILLFHSYYEASDNSARATLTAVSPALKDVTASIAMARSGDTVVVPAGRATWDQQLVIRKGISLIGAGIDKTIITSNWDNRDDSFSNAAYLLVYSPSSPALNEPFRLSGFTIDCTNKCRPLLLKNDDVRFIDKIRIDHNRILGGYLYYVIQIKGHVWGVADHNILDGCYISIDFLDDTTWKNYAFKFGTADAFYFEDNTMVGRAGYLIIRSEMGAMWCSRYNIYDGSNMTTGLYPWHDAHGNQPNAHAAVMGVEIYENVLNHPHADESAIILHHRGGKALVYNNNANTIYAVGPRVDEEYNDGRNPPATNPISGQPQHVSDSYYWGNRRNGTISMAAYIGMTVDYGGSIGIVPRENRDFWQENALFNGTTGIGVGRLANRPKTCNAGVAYWATDTRTLYKATASNVWEEYYRPFTYPHPLTRN